MLNQLFGDPLGKLFHFAKGGVVPGFGTRDNVPAMLTPGERVIPVGQAGGGDTHIHIVHNGNVIGTDGVNDMHADWARSMKIRNALPVASAGPGTNG